MNNVVGLELNERDKRVLKEFGVFLGAYCSNTKKAKEIVENYITVFKKELK